MAPKAMRARIDFSAEHGVEPVQGDHSLAQSIKSKVVGDLANGSGLSAGLFSAGFCMLEKISIIRHLNTQLRKTELVNIRRVTWPLKAFRTGKRPEGQRAAVAWVAH